MKRLLTLAALLLTGSVNAEIFYRDFGTNSVVLSPICVPSASGVGWFALDFDTTSLNITVVASGKDGANYTTYDYTGGNIDDGPGDQTWGDPTTSAVEVDAIATGAASGCISLSLRDEVMETDGWEQISILFTDGESAIMDHHVQILPVATGPLPGSVLETTIAGTTSSTQFTLTDGSADDDVYNGSVLVYFDGNDRFDFGYGLISDYTGSNKEVQLEAAIAGVTIGAGDRIFLLPKIGGEIGSRIIEDQGSTYDLDCAIATLLAYAAGDVSTSGGISTYQDPSGSENRIVGTVSGSSRGSITITCP